MNKNVKSVKHYGNPVEDTTKYPEFVCSYYRWLSFEQQRAKADELARVTKW